MNKVYVVIVNYNNFADTVECLESVLKSNYNNFQLFVVDNSSDDLSIKQLSAWVNDNDYSPVTTAFGHLVLPLVAKPVNHIITDEQLFSDSTELFESRLTIIRAANRGFAAANNLVFRYIQKNGANDSLIWILNNDTVVEKDTLRNLVVFYERQANKKQVLGAKLRYYHNPGVIQAIAGNYNKWLGRHRHVGEGEADTGQYDNYVPKQMDYIVGATMFLPKLFVEEAGLMCEDYFLYFEELDWLKNGDKHGYSIALVPNAIVYHKEGASITEGADETKDTSVAEYYSITNRVRFIKKWYPWRLITVMPGVGWALLKRLFKGKFALVKKSSVTIFKILVG
jgi:hypothetical protein